MICDIRFIEDVQSTDRTELSFPLLVRSADPADRRCDGRDLKNKKIIKDRHNKVAVGLKEIILM